MARDSRSPRAFPSGESVSAARVELRRHAGGGPERDGAGRAPCGARPGRRVAGLSGAGFTVVVERGAGSAAPLRRRAIRGGGRDRRRGRPRPRRGGRQGAEAVRRGGREAPDRRRPDRASSSRSRTPRDRAARRAGRGRVRDGVDPADHARAADGRALVAGDRRRLQGGAARRRPAAEVLPDADDRGRARCRRRRCSCSARASPGSRRSRPPAASAPSSPASTCAPP